MDCRKKLLANITANGSDVALVTITAPGREALTHDHNNRVDPHDAYDWNVTAPVRVRELHRVAAQNTRRKHGRFSLVATAWEYQGRGVLHRHHMVRMGSAADRRAAQFYAWELDRLRESYGFGFIDRGKHRGRPDRHLEVIPAERAARYVAKYLAPLDAGKPAISETAKRDDCPAHLIYVDRKLTQLTRITMTSLRRRRYAWALTVAAGASPARATDLVARGLADDLIYQFTGRPPPEGPPGPGPRMVAPRLR